MERPYTKFSDRKTLFAKLQTERKGRIPIFLFTFDRQSQPPSNTIPGLACLFASDTKEILYRLLKESDCSKGIDLVLYTRGGDTNAVWPLISLLREFDTAFEILAPFRCHSAGTLLALGAKKIHMTRLSELSPIDPTTANQFNPKEGNQIQGISVEDVKAFFDLRKTYATDSKTDYLEILTKNIHPLALGNVQRVYSQIRKLASSLLTLTGRISEKKQIDKIVETLSSEFYSHLHAISRQEARDILGSDHVSFASDKLEEILDEILRVYENTFHLRDQYILTQDLGDQPSKAVKYIGGVCECEKRSYVFKTTGMWYQNSKLPPGVQVNLPVGASLPMIPGLSRDYLFKLDEQDWVNNTEDI